MKKSKLLIPCLSLTSMLAVVPTTVSCNNGEQPSSVEHTIQFTASQGGSLSGSTTIKVKENTRWGDVTKPKWTPDSGYDFTGWFNGETTITDDNYKITSDLTIQARFHSITSCTVTFSSTTGGSISGQTQVTVSYGTKWGEITKPSYSEEENYALTGWFYNDHKMKDEEVIPTNMNVVGKFAAATPASKFKWDSKTIPTEAHLIGYTGEETDVVIPNVYVNENGTKLPVTRINGFASNKKIKNVVISKSVDLINIDAFWDCSNLSPILIPDSVTGISGNAFRGCKSNEFTSMSIPASVIGIGTNAFAECPNLKTFSVDNWQESMVFSKFISDNTIVDRTHIETLTINGGNIPTHATDFYDACFIQNLTLGANIESYADNAFSYSVSLKNLTIEKCIDTLKLATKFNTAAPLESLTIKSGKIGDNAFGITNPTHDKLSNLVLGEGVTNIGDEAFKNHPSLTQLAIPSTIESIGSNAFLGCGATEATFNGVKAAFEKLMKTFGTNWNGNIKTIKCNDGDITIE